MAEELGIVDRLSPGHVDDGSEDGIVQTRSLGSDWVRLPIMPAEHSLTASTAGVAGVTNATGNPDGTGLGVSLTAPQVTSGATSSATYERVIWGDVGFRINRSTSTFDVDIVIDGCTHAIRNTRNRRYASGSLSFNDAEGMWTVDEDIGVGPHNVQAVLVGQPVDGDGSSRSVGSLGWMGNRRWYEPLPRLAYTSSATVAVPTTAGVIPVVGRLGAVRWIDFTSASADRVVSIQLGAGDWFKLPVANGRSARFELPSPVVMGLSILGRRWIADGAGVTATIWETA